MIWPNSFCVTRDSNPWFLVEVKRSGTHLSDSLRYFQRVTQAPHAFQAVADLPFVDADCFTAPSPVVAPLVTLLSQLV
jgi:uncharacterized protein